MRKILLIILVLCMAQLLFGATLTLPEPFVYPYIAGRGGTSQSTLTINDDTDEIAYGPFQFPTTGTLTAVAITTGTITTGETAVPFRIETLDASGNPSGTLYDANGTGTLTIAGTDDNVIISISINGGTGITVTAADWACFRFKRNAAGALVGAFRYSDSGAGVARGSPPMQDYNIGGAAVWTKTGAEPMIALNIGGWVTPHGCLGGVIATTSEAFASTAERGIQINLPMSVRAVGAAGQLTYGAASSLKYTLYSDPSGTPTSRAVTAAIDSDYAQSAAQRVHRAQFTTAFTTTADTAYVLAVTPQDATNMNLFYHNANATYRAAWPGGTNASWWSRASTGVAFSESTNRVPLLGIIYDQIITPASGTTVIGIIARLRGREIEPERKILWAQ